MAKQTIIHGECLEKMRLLVDDAFDVCVTSPPYNINKKYKNSSDSKPREAYLNWMGEVFKEIQRILKKDGSFFLNVGFANKDPWLPLEVAARCKDIFVLQNTIIWVKTITVDKKSSGHFKPVISDRFINNNFEYLFHFTKTGTKKLDRLAIGVPYADKANIERWGQDDDLRCRGNTWYIPYNTMVPEATTGTSSSNLISETNWVTVSEASEIAQVTKPIITVAVDGGKIKNNGLIRRERRIDREDLDRWMKERLQPKKIDHPAMFPLDLPKMCIKLHGISSGMRIIDPFLGCGTTLIAAKELDVEGVGIEISEEYAIFAKGRIGPDCLYI